MVAKAEGVVSRIMEVVFAQPLPKQPVEHAMTILIKHCFSGRLIHMLRSGFCQALADTGHRMDHEMRHAFRQIWCLPELDEFRDQQLSLRLKDGGMGLRRVADLAGAATIPFFIDNYQAIEEALGKLGLSAQMVLCGKGVHPRDVTSRVAAELQGAYEHYHRLEGSTVAGLVPWHLLLRPTRRDGDDEAANENAVELVVVPAREAQCRTQGELTRHLDKMRVRHCQAQVEVEQRLHLWCYGGPLTAAWLSCPSFSAR